MEETTTETKNGIYTLEYFLGAFFRHKQVAGVVFIGVFALAAVISLMMPKQYDSSMKLLVKSERADLVVSPEAHPAASTRSEVTESQINSEIELLTSDEILTEVVKKCQLTSNGNAQISGKSKLAEEEAVKKLRKNIKISPVRKADIIDVSYSAASPAKAASVLKELASAYLEMHLRVHQSVGTQDFFRKQTERYEADLHDFETRLNDFRRVNNLVSIGQQKDLLVRRLLDSEASLQEANTAWKEANRQVDGLTRQLREQTPRIVTQNRTAPNQYSVERLNTMLAEFQNKRSQAVMKFRPDDRIVTEIDTEIANTRAALDRASKPVSTEQVSDLNPMYTTIERDLAHQQLERESLRVRCEGLTSAVADYRNRLAELERNTSEYNSLERGVKESEENYLLYSRKQEEARIADSLDQQKVANVTLAEAPVEHLLATKPNVGLNLLIGFTLAVLLSVATVVGLEHSSGYHTPSQVEAETGIPVLATVAWN